MSYRCADDGHFEKRRYQNDGVLSQSYLEQTKVENSINDCYRYFRNLLDIEPQIPELHRQRIETFLLKGLERLSDSYSCLDASRPWLCYWILHSMCLLNIPIDAMGSRVVGFLKKCQAKTGGFGGGPGQLPHLATSYAAVNALCIIATDEAYQAIDREGMQSFLTSMHMADGGFIMHEGGEVDIRGAYCAASIATLTSIMTTAMFDGTAEWIVSCQTYEGGFGGCPDLEAHGGYSFCGLAALLLLGKERLCDMKSLLRWTSMRQMSFEGGFQGRTNKLVDGCYSFWQGGVFPLAHLILSKQGDDSLSVEKWMFHQEALQEYLLLCCQHPGGALIDKPGKPKDYYHTCYCLSGMSVAQHFDEGRISQPRVVGVERNELATIHPIFNIETSATANALQYFAKLTMTGEK